MEDEAVGVEHLSGRYSQRQSSALCDWARGGWAHVQLSAKANAVLELRPGLWDASIS